MDIEKVIFTPLDQSWDWVSVGFGIITLLGIAVLIYQFKSKREVNPSEISSNPIIALVALATILAASAFIYSKKTSYEYETVEISSEHIQTPYGKCKVSDVKAVYILDEADKLISSEVSPEEKFLIIKEASGHTHPLSSKTYDIDSIHKAWKKLTENKSSFLVKPLMIFFS